MGKVLDEVMAVSDPNRPGYDPSSPLYDVTADRSSTFFVGPMVGDHKSGDELRAEAIAAIDNVTGPPGGFLDLLLGPVKNTFTQAVYQAKLEASRQELTGNVELRAPGEPPRTMWENASHEQMVAVISSNADSSAVAVTSEEWVRLGNDLSDHQESFGKAINSSLGDWDGMAGDAARRHLAQVATWLGGTAEGAVLTGRQQEIHSQALSETQRVMADNPPVPFSAPEANARLAQITDPAQYAMQFQTELDTFNQQQAARGQAAAVMQRYDETVGGAAVTPRFTAPPSLLRATRVSAPLQGTTADPLTVRRNASAGTPADAEMLTRQNLPAGTTAAGYGTPSNSLPAANLPGVTAQGTPSLPSAHSPAAFTAPNGVTAPSGVVAPGAFTPPTAQHLPTAPSGYGGNVPGNTTTPSTFTKPTIPTSPFGEAEPTTRILPKNRPTSSNPNTPNLPVLPGRGPGGVPPVTGGLPGGGNGPGVNRFGPGSMPGGGPGGIPGGGAPGAGAAGRGGFGPMGGAGAGAGGAASGVAGGAQGGPGAPGGAGGARGLGSGGSPMGGGGAPGGRSRGEDDDEYQGASYLEGDAEIFAPGEVVSPPVIGDWHGNQDWK